MSAAWEASHDAATWIADGSGDDDLADEVSCVCLTCDGMSTFEPDMNDEDQRLVCIYDGTLMDGAADWT